MSETRKELIIRLTDSGELVNLYKCGLLSSNVFKYRDISLYVHSLEAIGNGRMDAITLASDKFNVSIQTIYKALRWFNC